MGNPDSTTSKNPSRIPKKLMDDFRIFRGDTHVNSIKFLHDRIAYN